MADDNALRLPFLYKIEEPVLNRLFLLIKATLFSSYS
jgi:hypothetical protein